MRPENMMQRSKVSATRGTPSAIATHGRTRSRAADQGQRSGGRSTPDSQTPNSDTLYSFIGADLRSEPIVLTVPAMEKERYFSVQLIDYYTFNFDYIDTRTTSNGGGSFLLAGPSWKGETPKGVSPTTGSPP
jgi:hypothetical protein